MSDVNKVDGSSKRLIRGWRDESVVKSTICFSRGPGLES